MNVLAPDREDFRVPHARAQSHRHERVYVFILVFGSSAFEFGTLRLSEIDNPRIDLGEPSYLRRERLHPAPFKSLAEEVGEHRQLSVYGGGSCGLIPASPLVSLYLERRYLRQGLVAEEPNQVLVQLTFFRPDILPRFQPETLNVSMTGFAKAKWRLPPLG